MSVKKIAIFFSGEGSNMQNLIQKLSTHKDIKVELVLTNNQNANGIKRAKKLGFTPLVLSHKEFKNREEYDKKLVEIVKKHEIDLVLLAGFMRILTPIFTNSTKAINIHPSLLPKHKGKDALINSFHDSDSKAGVTVHWVSSELDGGEIVEQVSFDKDGLEFEEFEDRVHQMEHELYPKVVVEVLKSLA